MNNPQRSVRGAVLATLLSLSILSTGQAPTHVRGAEQSNNQPVKAAIQQNYGQLPLSFVPNMGQTDKAVHFQVNGLGGTLFFTPGEVVLSMPQAKKSANFANPEQRVAMLEHDESTVSEPPLVVKMQLVGANAEAKIAGTDPLPGIVNYFIGNDPSKWHTNISTYAGIMYRNVYPGIDLQYDGHEGRLKGTYTVAAGVDPSVIRWRYEGNAGLSIDDKTGDLLIALANGNVLREVAPTAWQDKAGKREAVETRYALGDGEVRFEIGNYDASLPLIIDPSFVYSTFLGGSGYDEGYAITADGSGNAYVTGGTSSTNFPTVNPTVGTNAGGTDVFVAKMNATGSALIYSTYLGGNGSDTGWKIAIDSSGNAYITGETGSTNFPTMNPFQATIGGGFNDSDAFVTKLNATGSALIYSTYLGGSAVGRPDIGQGIAVDSNGNVYVAGSTSSANFPTKNPLQGTLNGTSDAFVTKFNSTGNGLIYSTYLGGSIFESACGIAIDSSGNVYIAGGTGSLDFPTMNPLQAANAGGRTGNTDAFVAKLNAAGSALIYSTYLGGTTHDSAYDIAIDSSDSVYITGTTASTDFPMQAPFQGMFGGGTGGQGDGFVAKLNTAGSALVYSTYLGGTDSDSTNGIAIDSDGNAYIIGSTASTNFPPLVNPLQDIRVPSYGPFIMKLNATGSALIYSTYFGGGSRDIAVDSSQTVYVTGTTNNPNFLTWHPLQGGIVGGYGATMPDAFIAKISDTDGPAIARDTIGIFRSTDAKFYLKNYNATGFADSSFTFGASTDFPVIGDWNGDGIDTPGVYNQSTGLFSLTDSTTNPVTVTYTLVLGIPGDQPLVGDWDGDGKDSVGVFRPSNGLIYLKNQLTTGFADFTMVLGIPGDVGIAGDWDDNGKDSPGVYRPSNSIFFLSNQVCNCSVYADAQFGFGIVGDTPFVGDWDGDGSTSFGVYRRSNGLTYTKNVATAGFADNQFVFGNANDYPLAGYWARVSPPAAETAPSFVPKTK